MAQVRIEPLGVVITVDPGESLMQAAKRNGYAWPSLCQGDGECSICWMVVEEGGDNLAPMTDRERALLQLIPALLRNRTTTRFACQTRVADGSVVVRKKGVRQVVAESGA